MELESKFVIEAKDFTKNVFLESLEDEDLLFLIYKKEFFKIYYFDENLSIFLNEIRVQNFIEIDSKFLKEGLNELKIYKNNLLYKTYFFKVVEDNFKSDFNNLIDAIKVDFNKKPFKRDVFLLKRLHEESDSLRKLIFNIDVLKNNLTFKKSKVLNVKGLSSSKDYELKYIKNFDTNENRYFYYFLEKINDSILISEKNIFGAKTFIKDKINLIEDYIKINEIPQTKKSLLILKKEDNLKFLEELNNLTLVFNRLKEIISLSILDLKSKNVTKAIYSSLPLAFKEKIEYSNFLNTYLENEIFDYDFNDFKYKLILENKRKSSFELFLVYTFIGLTLSLNKHGYLVNKNNLLSIFSNLKNNKELRFYYFNFVFALNYEKNKRLNELNFKETFINLKILNYKNEELKSIDILFLNKNITTKKSNLNIDVSLNSNNDLYTLLKTKEEIIIEYNDLNLITSDQYKNYNFLEIISKEISSKLDPLIEQIVSELQLSNASDFDLF